MATYRFRVKYEPDSTALWRDIVVGDRRTLPEFQTTINDAMGLDRGHLWFIGADEACWNSDVTFQSPQEFDESADAAAIGVDETAYDAGEKTVSERGDTLEQYGSDW